MNAKSFTIPFRINDILDLLNDVARQVICLGRDENADIRIACNQPRYIADIEALRLERSARPQDHLILVDDLFFVLRIRFTIPVNDILGVSTVRLLLRIRTRAAVTDEVQIAFFGKVVVPFSTKAFTTNVVWTYLICFHWNRMRLLARANAFGPTFRMISMCFK